MNKVLLRCSRILFSYTTLILPVTLVMAIMGGAPAAASVKGVLPDFYSEPGLNPFRSNTQFSPNEVIDTFTGGLQLRHVDIFIPGNGGLNITIQRVYNSNNVYKSRFANSGGPFPYDLLPRSPFGMGWSLHFGRVIKSGLQDPCSSGPEDTLDNPVLELPDGSQQILFNNNSTFSGPRFITREQWVATCYTEGGKNYLRVYSPDGIQYEMKHSTSGGSSYSNTDIDFAWHTTQITDRNGNWIQITYDTTTVPETYAALPKQIKTSDNRTVDFVYSYSDPNIPLLKTITANGNTWTYSFQSDNTLGFYQLKSVAFPTGTGLSWDYTYFNYPDFSSIPGQYPGHRLLQQVKYPYRATVDYAYQYSCLHPSPIDWQCHDNVFYTLTVKSKTNGGADVQPATWTYSYATSNSVDTTTVTIKTGSATIGKHVYKHAGLRSVLYNKSAANSVELWKVGLLLEKSIFEGTSTSPVRTETNTWERYPKTGNISSEKYIRPPFAGAGDPYLPEYYESGVYFPVLTDRHIVQNGTAYHTVYSDIETSDASFNPKLITETGQVGISGQDVKLERSLTYFQRKMTGSVANIVRLVEVETYTATPATLLPASLNNQIKRSYDQNNANLLTLNRYGEIENYTYHGTGDLHTKTNALGKVWTYTLYERGIPKIEEHPVDLLAVPPKKITIEREVNSSGTIAWEKNGRGYTTTYNYDGLNRLANNLINKAITLPRGAPIGVDWSNGAGATRTVTRSNNYKQTTKFDGFGRPSLVTTQDTANGVNVYENLDYDALGNLSFKSYPSYSSLNPPGDTHTSDILGRPLTVTHPDSTFRTTVYSVGNKVTVTDENGVGHDKIYTYRSFGDPDSKSLINVAVHEDDGTYTNTSIARNAFGYIDSVTQGSVTRNYYYGGTRLNNRHFLDSENNPETGLTQYGRDAVGNMTSRQVGTSPVTGYAYDDMNRLSVVTYPNNVRHVRRYDGNNNITSIEQIVPTRTSEYLDFTNQYAYDENDNVISNGITFYKPPSSPTGNCGIIPDGLCGTSSLSMQYAYNDLDALSSITYPNNMVVTYEPNALGRATKASPYVTNVSYHPNRQPWTINYANGLVTTTSQNSRQWVSSINTTGGVTDLSYSTYDGVGNIKTIVDTISNTSRTMTYDTQDRLKTFSGVWGNGTASYDKVGNISTLNYVSGGGAGFGMGFGGGGQGSQSYNYAYDLATNRLANINGIAFSYDVYGNVLGNGDFLANYDDASNMIAITSGNYFAYNKYDGENKRVKSTTDVITKYLYSKDGNLMGEYADNGSMLKQYIYLDHRLIAVTTPGGVGGTGNSGIPTYYHLDALGSPIAATDSNGTVLWREEYKPFGERTQKSSAAASNTRWFTGHPQDDKTDLVYMGARWYDPVIGRFMATDPVSFTEKNLHSFNRYAYANNNPYKYFDPDGKEPLSQFDDPSSELDSRNEAGGYFGSDFLDYSLSGMDFAVPSGLGIKFIDKTIARTVERAIMPKGPYSHLIDHSSVGPGKSFTQAQKRQILDENIKKNDGVLRSDLSGKQLVKPKKHQKGVSPPKNEAHVDHVCERCAGGTNSSENARVLSREENLGRPGR